MRVGIAGLGTIGKALALALDEGMPGLVLGAIAARDVQRAQQWLERLRHPVPVASFDALPAQCDIVVECAPAHLLPAIARPMLSAGEKVVPLSVGALLDHMDLVELAAANGGQIIVPTGALLGLDAVTAAAEGTIHSVKMVTRKPLNGLAGAPFLVENQIRIDDLVEPLQIFKGTARDAARGFPANLNVAVALSLAGVGPDRTELEIWAVPGLQRNVHTINVDSDAATFSMTIENIPTDNPKTGRITAQSVLALLRKLGGPMRVGT